MAFNIVFEVGQITLSIAVVIASACIWIFKDAGEGIVFFMIGAVFTIVLRLIEQAIYTENFRAGRLEFQN